MYVVLVHMRVSTSRLQKTVSLGAGIEPRSSAGAVLVLIPEPFL